MAFSQSESATPSWQLRALDRSMSDVRARSVERLSLFVHAARELAAETGSSAFTVQQVVLRSRQSLKSFYRYFDGKDALLLALIEQDCSVGGRLLAGIIDNERTPVLRVRAWVLGVFDLMAYGDEGYVSVLVREHRRLAETRPDELALALQPLVQPLVDDLTMAMAEGDIRAGDPARDAHSILNLVLLYIHELLLAGRPDDEVAATAAYVWDFCSAGLRPMRENS
jgi:AcrR family transcriptional regulator